MLIVNALRYAEHSRAGHFIAGRTNHRFVRYITASTTCKIVVRHWRLEPSTTLITDFTGAFPATFLARSTGLYNVIKSDIFGPDFATVSMIIMSHPTVMSLKMSPRVIDHIALVSLITQNRSSVIKTSSIIPSPDKSPPKIG